MYQLQYSLQPSPGAPLTAVLALYRGLARARQLVAACSSLAGSQCSATSLVNLQPGDVVATPPSLLSVLAR